jgi:hypothetical protein
MAYPEQSTFNDAAPLSAWWRESIPNHTWIHAGSGRGIVMTIQGAIVDHMPTGRMFGFPDPHLFDQGESVWRGFTPIRQTLISRPGGGSEGVVTSIPYIGGIIRHFFHPFQIDGAFGPDTLALLWNFASGMGPRRLDERGILLPADFEAEGLWRTAQLPGATGAHAMPFFPDLATSIAQDLVAGRVGPNTMRYALFLAYGPYSRHPTPNLVHPGQIDIPANAILPTWERAPPYEVRPGYTARWELGNTAIPAVPSPGTTPAKNTARFVLGTTVLAGAVFWLVRRVL